MLRLNKTFNSFNVTGDQWTPYTYTKKRKEEWSRSRIFLFDLRSMLLSFIGWSTESAVARGDGSRGQKRLNFFFWVTEIESTSLCVWRARNDGGSPSEEKNFLSPAPSLLLFTINLHTFTFSLAAPGRKEGRPLAVKKKADKITSISPTRAIRTLPRLEINQEIDDRPRLSHEKRLVEECEIQGNKQQQKTQLCAPC